MLKKFDAWLQRKALAIESTQKLSQLLALLAWLETQDARLDFLPKTVEASLYNWEIAEGRIHRVRRALGVGENMTVAIQELIKTLNQQEGVRA